MVVSIKNGLTKGWRYVIGMTGHLSAARRCRDDAGDFLVMRHLVLCEVLHLKVSRPIDLIALDEARCGKVIQHVINVYVIGGEQSHTKALWPVFHPPFTVSLGPKADEQEASCKVQLHQMLVRKEPWLDVS